MDFRCLSSIALCLILCLPQSSPGQSTYYVSTSGNDAHDGKSLATAFRTIQKAANTAGAGSTVYILGGTYNERISINKSGNATKGYITYMPYNGQQVIVDATGLSGNSDNVFFLYNRNYIRITGLEIRNNTVPNNKDGAGIFIEGKGNFLEVRRCTIHHMTGTNAMAIAVYGTNKKNPIQNLVIDSNWVYQCEPAPSEAIVLNGNVRLFQVTNNLVHDVNNIGIDFIGGEGTCPSAANDNARNGICSGNVVFNARSSYGGGYAAGIYIDGGDSIIVERNRIYNCDLGLEVGCENKNHVAAHNIIRNNIIHHNDKRGLSFGGYNYPQTGKVEHCQFLNNTLYANDVLNVGEGELYIEYANQCTVKNNIIVGNGDSYLMNFYVTGTTDNVFDYNCWHVTGGTQRFVYNNVLYTSFASYLAGSGQDVHSLNSNPQLTNPSGYIFQLQATSPCIDAGDPAFVAAPGEKDFYGNDRLFNNRVDIGAAEYHGGSRWSADTSLTIRVYPVVATQRLHVQLSGFNGPITLELFDASGRRCHHQLVPMIPNEPVVIELDVSRLPAGMYVTSATSGYSRATAGCIIAR